MENLWKIDRKSCHQLCEESGEFGFKWFLAYAGSTSKIYDTILINGVIFHLTQVKTVGVSISHRPIEMNRKKLPRTFFTKF